jgi:hypothetical protein
MKKKKKTIELAENLVTIVEDLKRNDNSTVLA